MTKQERSFERLYRRHRRDVYRYALAVLRNRDDAEDVVQQTFLNAYSALEDGVRPVKPKHWLIKIAHNVCRQRFRDSRRRPTEVELNDELAAAAPAPSGALTVAEIQEALAHLTFNQRAALVARELEGRSYAEIAALLDLSTSAIETLLFRARRTLREHVEGALTCTQAEEALSRDMDGELPRAERGPLRAHLRACADCERLARSMRARRRALRGIFLAPAPWGLGAPALIGVGTKAAAVVCAGTVAVTVGLDDVAHRPSAAQADTRQFVPHDLPRVVPWSARHVVLAGRPVVLRHRAVVHPRATPSPRKPPPRRRPRPAPRPAVRHVAPVTRPAPAPAPPPPPPTTTDDNLNPIDPTPKFPVRP